MKAAGTGLVLRLPDGRERPLAVGSTPVVLGRGADADVRIEDPAVSRRHLEFVRDADRLLVRDLGSASGTTLNGAAFEGTRALAPGDRLTFGAAEIAVVAAPLPFPSTAARAGVITGDLERDVRNVEALLATVAEFQSLSDLDALLVRIVDRAIELAGGARGAILLAGRGGPLERLVARDASGRDLPADEAIARTLPARAVDQGRAIVLTDADRPDQRTEATPSVVAGSLRSVLAVPLPSTAGPLGVLYVDGRRPAEGFGPAELAFYEALAAQGAAALERARLEREARRRLEAENERLRARLGEERPIGESAAYQETLEEADRVARSDLSVLLAGETGSGKEVLARRIHDRSPRRSGPFVAVDCGAIPEGLVESELFGHEKGAFTGAASSRPGLFRAAGGGTIFLDEIGELPPAVQAKLLRVLQQREVVPVGSERPVGIDVRVVAATHRDLAAMVEAGAFRQDLLFRLAGMTIAIPPLSERGDDALLLARAFLDRFAGALERPLAGFTRDALEAIRAAAWPGNVRELEHAVHRAVVLADGPFVRAIDLGLGDSSDAGAAEEGEGLPSLPEARRRASDRFERDYVAQALRAAGGNVTRAARQSGVSRQLFQRLMSRHRIARDGA